MLQFKPHFPSKKSLWQLQKKYHSTMNLLVLFSFHETPLYELTIIQITMVSLWRSVHFWSWVRLIWTFYQISPNYSNIVKYNIGWSLFVTNQATIQFALANWPISWDLLYERTTYRHIRWTTQYNIVSSTCNCLILRDQVTVRPHYLDNMKWFTSDASPTTWC